MANIQTRRTSDGKVRYRVQVRLRGYPPQSATFERRTDARKWAQATEAAIREGRHFSTVEARRHTLGDLVDRYVRDVLPNKPRIAGAQRAQLLWWKSAIGERTLADVTPALVGEQRDALRRARGPATTNRYLAAISHAFTIAVNEWGWLQENPCRKVRRLTEPRGRVRFLDEDEQRRLLHACRESPLPALYPVVLLAVSTGARRNEVLGLRWRDVDFNARAIRLEETKNTERRAVPLTGAAHDTLQRWAKVRRIDTDLVFPRRDGQQPVEIRHYFGKALEAAGVEDFRFHDLRHTAASYLAMSGATLAEISNVLGHKTLAMVKRYAHMTEQHTSAVVERMNERFLNEAGNA